MGTNGGVFSADAGGVGTKKDAQLLAQLDACVPGQATGHLFSL
jgi:hypothetical protein